MACKDIAATTLTDIDKERERLLANLAKAMSRRPLDLNAIAKARQEIVDTLGYEILVEAAGVAGTFEIMTKVTTACGKLSVPSSKVLRVLVWIMGFVFTVLRWLGFF